MTADSPASLSQRLRDGLRKRLDPAAPQAFPPGHFYSPVVDVDVVLSGVDRSRIWPSVVSDPAGVDLRAEDQLALLARLAEHRLPTTAGPAGARYDPGNDQFPPHDARVLYAMIRLLRPARVIEVGSGWSTIVTSAAIVDEGLSTHLTCIEPYPRSFLSSLAASRADQMVLREERVEHVPLEVFEALEPGDVCFIDSSHVVKAGSDVVHELLVVVPRLAEGVIVHVHDIFIPEDYPEAWVRSGFNWTEQYLLQGLLVGHQRARVLLANHWLALRHPDAVRAAFGEMKLDGSSFWFSTGPITGDAIGPTS